MSGLCVKWAKAGVRSERWWEDILLEEEMRRSLEYCWRRSHWWMIQAIRRTDAVSHLAEGLYAYAVEQSYAEEQRAIHWTMQWAVVWE